MKFASFLTSVFVLFVFSSICFGQVPTPAATPAKENGVKELKLSFPSISDELKRAEIEPRSKQFKINLRFLRAKFSQVTNSAEDAPGKQYGWNYFPEASVVIQYFELPTGYFTAATPEQKKLKAAKLTRQLIEDVELAKLSEKAIKIGSIPGTEFELASGTRKITARTFAKGDVWYVLMFIPKIDNTTQLSKKLFDSFEFVEK